ncbi:MAG: flagellar hook-associated protein FlgK [Planctomycetaceae bacterium]|nr:flagellar hook-associated protein FlgK [Planctomycetaceae bacterium]
MSLNSALATSSHALGLFSLGIQVAGQNINNASTPGYVRDELTVEAAAPYRVGGVIVGGGARAVGIRQVLDRFLETRIHQANTDAAGGQARTAAFEQLELSLQEFSDSDLSSSLNRFLNELQSIVNQPDDAALRSSVIQSGVRFASDIQSLRSRLGEVQLSFNEQLTSVVGEANSLISQIEKLNQQINQLEAGGLNNSDAGGLRVQRLSAIDRLSQIMPIRAIEQSSGMVDIYSGSEYLVLNGVSQRLETFTTSNGDGTANVQVRFSRTQSTFTGLNGQLGGLIDGRDQILGGFLKQLDTLTQGVISAVNQVHASGEGTAGFTTVTGTQYVADTSAALNSAGIPFSIKHGGFDVKVVNLTTGLTTTTRVAIDLDGIGTDTSLTSLAAAIDGIDNLSASITPDGRLQIKTADGHEVRFADDSSGALAALGINTFFKGTSSLDIAVNDRLLADQRLLATGQGGGPTDNRNAVALAKSLESGNSALNGLSATRFYEQMVGTVAATAATERAVTNGFTSFRDTLKTQREQTSGVSLDEEAIRVMNLQRNYQAAARIISVVDELLNTLINI